MVKALIAKENLSKDGFFCYHVYMKKKKGKIYNIILLSILCLFFLAVLLISLKDLSIIFQGEKTEGNITVDWIYIGKPHQVVRINFTDSENKPYNFVQTGFFQPIHNTGDVVTVYYDKKNPNFATQFSVFNFIYLLLGLIGTTLISFCIIKLAKKD